MLELLEQMPAWFSQAGTGPCAVATIVGTQGSVPRPVGTSMLVSADGVLGSLSGGCVEGAVIALAREALADGQPRREHFGYSAEDAFAAGLTCGGSLDVHIRPYTSGATAQLAALAAESPGSTALIRRLDDTESLAGTHGGPATEAGAGVVVVRDPQRLGGHRLADELAALLGEDAREDASMGRRAAAHVAAMVRSGLTGVVTVSPEQRECFGTAPTLLVESRLPAPRMLIFGANDFGAALLPGARLLGFHVTICDAREAFAGQERFRAADSVAIAWPHRYLRAEADAGRVDARTVVCVLGHDPKFDIPLLAAALDLDLAYVGAMGSRRSHGQRVASLLQGGTDRRALARLHSPIGLDLAAETPAEVAVSILAEVVAARHLPGHPKSLMNGTGAIHHSELAPV
ncbi:XdhC family protein [Arthrobacter sp. 35W]|uniref:XdhC family protein n=1 Tax=Arthrobacter sp. 35W TaxID=1132441 RepID=UPI00047E1F65|nr:XdhC/CoxI family protein [Arthrobacter sp. 35W]